MDYSEMDSTDLHIVLEVEKNPILWDNRKRDKNKKGQEVVFLNIAERWYAIFVFETHKKLRLNKLTLFFISIKL